jgi:hypothetical protein
MTVSRKGAKVLLSLRLCGKFPVIQSLKRCSNVPRIIKKAPPQIATGLFERRIY